MSDSSVPTEDSQNSFFKDNVFEMSVDANVHADNILDENIIDSDANKVTISKNVDDSPNPDKIDISVSGPAVKGTTGTGTGVLKGKSGREKEKERIHNANEYVNTMMMGLWRAECRRCVGQGVGVPGTGAGEGVLGTGVQNGSSNGNSNGSSSSGNGNGNCSSSNRHSNSSNGNVSSSSSRNVNGISANSRGDALSSHNMDVNTIIDDVEDEAVIASHSRGGYNVLGRSLKVFFML